MRLGKKRLKDDRDIKPVEEMALPLAATLACAILLLIAFAWLATEVLEGSAQQFDLRSRQFVHQFASPPVTVAMERVTFLGSPAILSVLFAVVVVICILSKRRRPAAWVAIAMGGAFVLDFTLKQAFHRARPVPFFGLAPHSYSFPSGHALGSLCFYGVLAGLLTARIRNRLVRVLIWTAGAALVIAIGFSRIYLGVHYATDVIAGYIAAAIWISMLLIADRMYRPANPK